MNPLVAEIFPPRPVEKRCGLIKGSNPPPPSCVLLESGRLVPCPHLLLGGGQAPLQPASWANSRWWPEGPAGSLLLL